MMKVTKTTHSMLMNSRHEANKKVVKIQAMRKNGTWGATMEVEKLYNESDEDVVSRMIKNNNKQYRLAQ
jgi:hypothetical protein